MISRYFVMYTTKKNNIWREFSVIYGFYMWIIAKCVIFTINHLFYTVKLNTVVTMYIRMVLVIKIDCTTADKTWKGVLLTIHQHFPLINHRHPQINHHKTPCINHHSPRIKHFSHHIFRTVVTKGLRAM